MNTAVHFNPRIIKTIMFPQWKKLKKTTRWMLLGNWNQEDEAVYGEMIESDPTFKPTQQLSSKNKEGKATAARRKADRQKRKEDGGVRDFASFGGHGHSRKSKNPEIDDN